MKKGVIYKVWFTNNKYFLIGSTLNPTERFRSYKRELRQNKYCNKILQHVYNKYNGAETMKISILRNDIPKDILFNIEDIYMGANCSRFSDKRKGMNLRNATTHEYDKYIRKKISNTKIKQQLKGKNSPNYGKKASPEALINLSKSRTMYKVCQYDLEGNFIKEWENIKSINLDIKITFNTISKACIGLVYKAYGFLWRYKDKTIVENNPKIEKYNFIRDNSWLITPYYELNEINKLVKMWPNRESVAESLNIHVRTLKRNFNKSNSEILTYKNRKFTKNKNLINE